MYIFQYLNPFKRVFYGIKQLISGLIGFIEKNNEVYLKLCLALLSGSKSSFWTQKD